MDQVRINSGEFISSSVLKVDSLPHVSTLSFSKDQSQDFVVEKFGRDMAITLSEIYNFFKDTYIRENQKIDIALELTWLTVPVENQPHTANIEMYINLRCINSDTHRLERVTNVLTEMISSALQNSKYEITTLHPKHYYNKLPVAASDHIIGIVKEERLEDLQNQYLPACFAFDRFPTDYKDFSKLASILISHPDIAVSFQLMPTYYSNDEINELNKITQLVNQLNRGVNDTQIGNVSISAAGKVYELYKYYSSSANRPLFNFNIIVYGDNNSSGNVASRLLAQLCTTDDISPTLKFVNIPSANIFGNLISLYSLPWVINDYIINSERNTTIWQSGLASVYLFRIPYIITSEEAASFFRLPIATDNLSAGFNVNETVKKSKSYSEDLIDSGDIELGKLKSSNKAAKIGLKLKDLAKHMLVVGTPGSGKTTFSVGLLDRLWKDHGIPFLVIEPAKNEYRALVQSIPELQVFTPGKNFISPFVFNPFLPPKNVKLETYKSTLKTAFAAGVSMSSPLDKIFEDTINNCYSDFRWLDTYTSDNMGRVFNISDFIKCFKETFDEIGYTGDARNIGRAGLVRLKSLVNLFDNYFSIPIEDILSKPTIIELAAIENSDQKALIIALLLLSILSYVNANFVGEGGLRNFILIEEAHVLLDSESKGGEGASDPSAIAQGLVKRMLAEIRSYGVGIAIADQSPRKVGTDIVALTDIKVAFRLVEGQDKEILANSSGMTEIQQSRLAKLKPGEAFLFFNRLDEPEEIVTPDYRLANNIAISLSDEGIRDLSTFWKSRQEKLRPYPECEKTPYCNHTCNYYRKVLAKEVARRIFKKYIGIDCKDGEKIKFVLSHISSLIKNELNDEPYNRELLSCVKVFLWRTIRYETQLRVAESTIENSLIKE